MSCRLRADRRSAELHRGCDARRAGLNNPGPRGLIETVWNVTNAEAEPAVRFNSAAQPGGNGSCAFFVPKVIAAMIRPNGVKADKKRLLRVTTGNVRHSHVYVNGHYDFFPPDCIGGARRSADSRTIEIHLDGLDRTVRTDIGRDAKTGKPRGFFRARGWVRQFFERHKVKPGAFLALERLSERSYQLSVQRSEEVESESGYASPARCLTIFARRASACSWHRRNSSMHPSQSDQ